MRAIPGAVLLSVSLLLSGCTVTSSAATGAQADPSVPAPPVVPSASVTVPAAAAASPAAAVPSQVAPSQVVPSQVAPPSVASVVPSAEPVAPSPASSSTPSPEAAASVPAAEAAATPAPSPSTAPVDPEPAQAAAAEPEPDRGLRPGDSGPEVLALQQRLGELGYWTGGADGSFGALTTQAVLALQKAAGLSRDGVVGPATEGALAAGTRPQARVGGDGVEIDLQRQLLLVVRDGQVQLALNTSTGTVGVHDTPPGSFRVQRAIDGLREAPLGDLWRPRYFNRGIAVHGSPSIPAHAASHGCARLSDAAVDMIWSQDLMPIGSAVTVY